MALDGIVLANIAHELIHTVQGGRIDKIYQPQKDELLVSIRSQGKAYKVLFCANSTYPRIHLSTLTENTAQQPPMFCMLLRKHLSGGKIVNITQPSFERILEFHIRSTNELGDEETKKLIIEIMGRHSNIILTKSNDIILDSMIHVSSDKSSLRQVLPGKLYTYPANHQKLNPLTASISQFSQVIGNTSAPLFKAIYQNFNGLSPLIAKDLCLRAQLDFDCPSQSLSAEDCQKLYETFKKLMDATTSGDFSPRHYLDGKEHPIEFYSFPLIQCIDQNEILFESSSAMLEAYYHTKSNKHTVHQKTADLKKMILTFIDRNVRKKAIQEKALEECKDAGKFQTYGELLTAYSYSIEPFSESFTTIDYTKEPYESLTIPLNPKKTAIENAQSYFKKYQKSKRTQVAANEQLHIIGEDLAYLQSVLHALDVIETEEDIAQLRQELIDMGYLKKKRLKTKGKQPKNKHPYMRFTSSTGHPIYVGKNNYQNDSLTMKFAHSGDLWLHIKDGPGSHVIVRLENGETISEATLLEAAHLAAYYSSGKLSSNVPIDYTLKKYVKKVAQAKPGMVIYTDFKTLYITPDEKLIKRLKENNKKD